MVGRTEPPPAATFFDLASISKPIMASLALELARKGLVPLDLRLGRVFPDCAAALSEITLEALLRHQSGMQAWYPLYTLETRARVESFLLDGGQLGAPVGTYSDLGYILWGLAIERCLGQDLEAALMEHLLVPAGLHDSLRRRPGEGVELAKCDCDGGMELKLAAQLGMEVTLRQAPTPGCVQDGNAAFLGGLAGHAGLFGTVAGVLRFARLWLDPLGGRRAFLDESLVVEAVGGQGPEPLGWARRPLGNGSGPPSGDRSFGHTGFAGGVLVVDPDHDGIALLLGHRVKPLSDLGPMRRAFVSSAVELLVATRDHG